MDPDRAMTASYRTAPCSLIVASRNRAVLLTDTIQSVLAGETVPAEMVVVDQSDRPEPGLQAMEQRLGGRLLYLWKPGSGVSRARNQGVATARYECLLFMDDDMVVTVTWCSTLFDAVFAYGAQAIVTGKVRAGKPESDGALSLSTRTEQVAAVYAGRQPRDVLWTGNMGLWRQTFDALHGFDQRLGPGTPFPSSEDNDFCFRALESGCTVVYEPEAVLYHRAWRPARMLPWVYWQYGAGAGGFYAKHFLRAPRYMGGRVRREFGYHLRRLPAAVRHDRGQAIESLAYCSGVVFGFTRWTAQRP